MPGRNCSIPGCSASHYYLYKGIEFDRVPTRKSEYSDYDGWRKRIFDVISKYRPMTSHEKARFYGGKYYVCSQHYSQGDLALTSKYHFALSFLYI